MMRIPLFSYVTTDGKDVIQEWIAGLQKKERAKLRQKLDFLGLHGEALYPEVLTGTDVAGILKLRVHGGVQLRPLLCRGPVHMTEEYTLLLGAKEVGGKFQPKNALVKAAKHKADVIANPTLHRASYKSS